ncbi:hypothetical protein [Tenacibaculum haliotis]|uniref:hypothetical protein n=1 Tax=Tenacibaculum haliotis TaxID=1888914 RepID=UPI0021AFA678|nr:hypothetical protein [Tenacibaculum haliotis]MCT4697548.1 hypothetical protein [Tenacibaculum haliotis]
MKINLYLIVLFVTLFSCKKEENVKIYFGNIDNKVNAKITLEQKENDIVGTFYDLDKKKELKLKGILIDNKLTLQEYSNVNKITGFFEGVIKNDTFKGHWLNTKKTIKVPFLFSSNLVQKETEEKKIINEEVIVSQPVSKCRYEETLNFSPDLNGFMNMINKLNKNSLQSISISRDFVKNRLPSNIKITDDNFYSYEAFLNNVINNYNEVLWNNQTLQSKINDYEYNYKKIDLETKKRNDIEVKNFIIMLNERNLTLDSSEGTYFIVEDSDFSLSLFKNNLSTSFIDYLKIIKVEDKHKFADDAALLISYEKLSERVITWERYIGKHKSLSHKNSIRRYKIYLSTLLRGVDNTPIYNYNNKTITNEIKTVYKKYITRYPNSKSGKVISKYYDYLEKNSFKFDIDKVNIFLTKNSLN